MRQQWKKPRRLHSNLVTHLEFVEARCVGGGVVDTAPEVFRGVSRQRMLNAPVQVLDHSRQQVLKCK